jgi:predicted acetyltransferase
VVRGGFAQVRAGSHPIARIVGIMRVEHRITRRVGWERAGDSHGSTRDMTTRLLLGPIADDSELSILARFLLHAFASPTDEAMKWMHAGGVEHLRVLRDSDRIVSCLMRIPMGIYLGGRSVPMMGIGGVAVPPEHRGRGYAREMMRAEMRQAARDGFSLAGLYASTQTLYRQIGFEQSAHRFRIEVPLVQIDVRDRGGAISPLDDADTAEMHACYASFARLHDGTLDRGRYVWNRVRTLRGTEYIPFGLRDDAGRLIAYAGIHQARKPESGRQNIELSDLVFLTPGAGRRMLGLVADFAMMGDDMIFHAGPMHPALMLIAQQRYRITSKDTHLLRVLDLASAIERRGFEPTVRAEVHLRIDDDLIDANRGDWIVRIEGGRGSAVRGGRGEIGVSARGLATIYAGFMTPEQAALVGLASGETETLRHANVFHRSTPWTSDQY